MRLRFDLRTTQSDGASPTDERHAPIPGIKQALRRPRQTHELLRGERYEEVVIAFGSLPPSSGQAGSILVAALGRSRRFVIERDAERREHGRLGFLLYAVSLLVITGPRDVVGGIALGLSVRAQARRPITLPRSTANPTSVAYLRTNPTLRWKGEFVGGAASHTRGVINGFVRHGLDVRLTAVEKPEGVEAQSFRPAPLGRMYHGVHWLTLAGLSRRIADQALADGPADFVYQRYTLGSMAGLEVAHRMNVPLVLEFNSSEIWKIRNWSSAKPPLFVKTLDQIEERNVRDASLVVVVSEALKEGLIVERALDPDRVLVNPNGVDIAHLARFREGAPAEWRQRMQRPEAPTVGFVGTFGPWHGVTVLPEIIEKVNRERPETEWILVGDGQHFPEVKAEIDERKLSDRVLLTGTIDHERALRLMAASDVCISPHVDNPDGSRFFGSPIKLFEYMGLKRPIVASDLEQIGQVIDHEHDGLLCPPGDAPAAAAAILRLLADPDLRGRLADEALRNAKETYSWEAHTQRVLAALKAGSATAGALTGTARKDPSPERA